MEMQVEPIFESNENMTMMKSSLSMTSANRTNSPDSQDRQALLKKK